MTLTKTRRKSQEPAPSHLFYELSLLEKQRAGSEDFEPNPNNSFSIESD